jgi:putative transposase
MDEKYLYAAVRYVERNPVRAGLVPYAENYAWSSARSHVFGEEDPLISDSLMLPERRDWLAYLRQEDDQSDTLSFRRHAHTGRPLGDNRFLSKLEELTGRNLRKRRPGRKPEPGR